MASTSFLNSLIRVCQDPWIRALLCGFLAWRLVLAAVLPFTVDGAYGLTMGREVSLSYFDHPPLSFWLAAASEALLGRWNEIGIRLPIIFLGSLTLLGFAGFIYPIFGLYSARIGVALFGMSWAGAITGIEALPDSILFFGLSWFFMILVHGALAVFGHGQPLGIWTWAIAGAALAVAFASKYQAVVVIFPVLIWIIVTPKSHSWLYSPGFWLAFVLALVGGLPALLWNMNHDWSSLSFQSGRIGQDVSFGSFVVLLLAQGLYLGPALLILMIRSAFSSEIWQNPVYRLMLVTGLFGVIFFNLIFIFSPGSLPHWPVPSWLALLAFAASAFSHVRRVWITVLVWVSVVAQQLIVLLIGLHMHGGVLALNCEIADWDQTSPQIKIETLRNGLDRSGLLPDAPRIYAPNWLQAGYISIALGPNSLVSVLSTDQRHFQFARSQILEEGVLVSLDPGDDFLPEQWIAEGFELISKERFLLDRGTCPYFSLTISAISQTQ